MKTTPLLYRKYLFIYGILSVLYVLQHFETLEMYEECKNIIDAIKEQEESLSIKLFTKITPENIQIIIDEFNKFNLTGKFLDESSKSYSEIIINEITNLNNK